MRARANNMSALGRPQNTTLDFYPNNSAHLGIQYHKYRCKVKTKKQNKKNDYDEGCTGRTARSSKASLR